ncbi:MFS transporter [Sphingobium cupriresistens]|uniref:MFS transporter n=1 Tax=Sphingobium cupriresistens TaxID=1132417 RepID=UPI003BF4E84F
MDQSDRMGAGRIALFSLPVVLFQAIELAWRAYLPQHLIATVGLSLGVTGLLMVAMRGMDAIADPIMGWMSDHVDTRYGRRKPWIMLGVPLVAIGALGLFLSGAGTTLMTIMLASVLLHLGYSLMVTPHGGWGLEIGRDADERTRLMSAKIWYASAGAIALLLVIAGLERGLGVGKAGVAATLGMMIALLAPLTVFPVIRFFKERPQPCPQPQHGHQPITGSVRAIFANPLLRKPLALYLLLGLADAASATCFLFLSDNVLQLHGWGATLLLIQPALALVTLPLWSRMSRRHGRERVLILAYGWQLIVTPFALLLPVGNLPTMIGYMIARNLIWGVDYALLRAMVADAADRDIVQGANRSGLYYGLSSIVLKLAMGLGAGGAIWLMSLARFDAKETLLSQGAEQAVRLAYAMPGLLGALAALIILTPRPTPGLGARAAST